MYLINSKFDFGMYSGYDVGLVYIFDPNYIKWCIHNVDEFCIDDLEDLQRYGVFEHNILEGRRDIRAPEAILGLNLFETFQEYILQIGNDGKPIKFDQETIEINNSKKLKYKKHS